MSVTTVDVGPAPLLQKLDSIAIATMDILLNTLYTTSYVGSLFVLPSARTGGKRVDPATGRPLTRDSPNVLRARLTGVGLSSIASLGAAAYVASVVLRPGSAVGGIQFDGLKRVPDLVDARRIAELLGLWKPSIQSGKQLLRLVAYPLACTMSLFLGPLYTSALDRRLPGMSAFSWRHDVLSIFTRLRGLRNYVIGPITEELVFRSCIVGTAALYGRSTKHLIFVTPLYFGIAHAHHAYEVYVNGGRTRRSLQQGVFSALFQTVYTSLFGFYAAFLFLRTGSVLPPILSHVFCNIMGFPQLTDAIQQRPAQKWIIIGAYLAGIAAFAKTLTPFTEPALFGGSALW